MDRKEKAKILDTILIKFKGGNFLSWDEVLKGKEFKKDVHEDMWVIKDHIDYLLANEYLQVGERYSESKKNFSVTYNPSDTISITGKGNMIVTDIENLGFKAQEMAQEIITKRDISNLKYAKYAFWAAIISSVLAGLALLK